MSANLSLKPGLLQSLKPGLLQGNFRLRLSSLCPPSGVTLEVMTEEVDWDSLERSLVEPEVPGPDDITSLEGLVELPCNVFKVTFDRGRTWSYHLIAGDPFLHFTGEIQVRTYAEKPATSGLPALPISDGYFTAGTVARPVTQEEAEVLEFDKSLRPRIRGHGLSLAKLRELQTERDGDNLPTEVSESSRAAARWWADCLRLTGNSGDAVAGHLSRMGIPLVGNETPRSSDDFPGSALPEEAIRIFESALARRIEALDPGVLQGKIVGTTYDPDITLGLAAAAAGIPYRALPVQTKMVVSPKAIGVEGKVVWRQSATSGPAHNTLSA
jgi:hypothetical protein